MTEEILCPTCFDRQVNDQIALIKAFVVISKESKKTSVCLGPKRSDLQLSAASLHCRCFYRRPLTVLDSEPTIHNMAALLYQAQLFHYDSATMIIKLKATIQSLERQMSYNSELHGKLAERSYDVVSKLTDNSLYHFCVFSDNIIPTSVVVNSTALNSKAPEKVVFHLVTNEINYDAMKSWFAMNMDNLRGVTVEMVESWLI
ncbi:probable galacturonosyltransferase 10 [Raphanus sativus]|uniref:Probable galacturonosyltransferase 10 n=1 Tax=Raphanus sativus TaxID=3726 RepID=A0A6J0MTP4_RAPSA|nr:probable galacturonosyltransferase 10 [Raphanus sativus]